MSGTRGVFLHVLRAFFVLAVVAVAWSYIAADTNPGNVLDVLQFNKPLVLVGVIVLALGVIAIDVFIGQKSLLAISGLFFGIIIGMVMAFGISVIIDLVIQSVAPDLRYPVYAEVATQGLAPVTDDAGHTVFGPAISTERQLIGYRDHPFISTLKIIIGVACCYMAVSFIIQTKDDVRFVIPYVEFAKQTKGNRPMLLDTSVIIDGRIADICETSIVETELIVPRFVLQELQLIADSSDRLKRNRGRRGLDILNRMQLNEKTDIKILDVHLERKDTGRGVDEMLVELAMKMGGRVVTNDYNLNKIAQLRGVTVININDLANALKPVFLPGEQMQVRIIRPGEGVGQGVGYLEDGTMVVAEGGRNHIGKTITLSVTSALQTSAGRMIFGRMESVEAGDVANSRRADGRAAAGRRSDSAEGPPERSDEA
ncbi:MAG TPA: PIN domain-containing protein [Phycisphaerae bacterium]|nr:PIN domain-containing protein [Phycisphaerae bacterium]